MHGVVRALEKEMGRVNSPAMLQAIIANLTNQVSQPNQASHQQQVAANLSKLLDILENSPIDGLSPAWRDAVIELGVEGAFGSKLKGRINTIFERNQITPKLALDELIGIKNELDATKLHLTQLSAGLNYFGVGEDVLLQNEAEVGVIIPRTYVDNNLKSFGAELVELEKILLVFSEVVTGTREPLKIRQISSSELSVFLEYLPEVCACIAISIERIVALYKSLLEIKTLKKGLIEQNVPEETLQPINDYAKSLVRPELDKLTEELMTKYATELDPDRANEVAIELRRSLYRLTDRIDRGFQIELRVSKDSSTPDNGSSANDARTQILKSAAKIQLLATISEPVLFLSHETDVDEANCD